MKEKTAQKSFTKNPIQGTRFTIAVSSAKGGLANQHLLLIWRWL